MNSPYDLVASALRRDGKRVNASDHSMTAQCPAHKDRTPSLSVTRMPDGAVRIKCFGGCSTDEVCAALGIEKKDLFPPTDGGASSARESRKETPYRYEDEDGQLLYEVVRRDPKSFRQRRPDGRGGWVWDLSGVRRVPYRLPALRKAIANSESIFFVEGEKDADRLVSLGLTATTTSQGAKGWRPGYAYSSFFADADVVILPDNDEPGRSYAATVADDLHGTARRVRVVDLPGLPDKGDVSDWLDAGHGRDEVESLVSGARDYQPPTELPAAPVATEEVELEGDHLNAARFLHEHGNEVRYSPELGRWLVWNGAWWDEDKLERVNKLANETIDNLRRWVAESKGDEFKRRASHYTASSRARRRDGMLEIARPDVTAAIAELDTAKDLLACRNGTVELRTGRLLSADRSRLITRGVALDYEPGARSEYWSGFLRTIFGGDEDLISYVQRLFGYAVTGETSEHVLADFYGSGQNGKTTLVNTVMRIIGDHAIAAPQGLLVEVERQHPHPERIAALRGRRLVVSAELEDRATLAEGLVKLLTGGDRLEARQLYGQRFQFEPTHTLVLYTNHLPQVRGTDRAIWRRIKVVPFGVTIEPDERIDRLDDILVAEHGQAVLAWLIEGAVAFYRDGLGTCDAVDEATRQYRHREDVIQHWLDERTTSGAEAALHALYEDWRAWATAKAVLPGREQVFAQQLAAHGVATGKRGRVTVATGLTLIGADDHVEDDEREPQLAWPTDLRAVNGGETAGEDATRDPQLPSANESDREVLLEGVHSRRVDEGRVGAGPGARSRSADPAVAGSRCSDPSGSAGQLSFGIDDPQPAPTQPVIDPDGAPVIALHRSDHFHSASDADDRLAPFGDEEPLSNYEPPPLDDNLPSKGCATSSLMAAFPGAKEAG